MVLMHFGAVKVLFTFAMFGKKEMKTIILSHNELSKLEKDLFIYLKV